MQKIHGPQLKKIGINQASTYNIFCSKHDAQLFSPIENRKFALENDQIFLIAYRNICYELYLKERIYQTRLERMQFDRGFNQYEQIKFQNYIQLDDLGTLCAIKELSILKEQYDKSLIQKDFSKVRYYCITINQTPQFMASACWIPTKSFDGANLANLDDTATFYNTISASITSYLDNQGIIIFSWLESDAMEDKYCNTFVKSLDSLPASKKLGGILNWFFTFTENLFIQPAWWDNLEQKNKEKLIECIDDTNETTLLQTNYSEFSQLTSWEILSIRHNLKY